MINVMITERVFIDVNVPMYAAGKPHAYRDASIWVLEQIVEDQLDAVIDTEIIQEVLYRFGAVRQWTTASRMAENLLELMPNIYPITPDDASMAIQLFEQYGPQGVKARDVIHVAVMKNHGMTQIISTDRHFDQVDGITRLDPISLFNAG
jgi:predicted nucleic acid-binding protein